MVARLALIDRHVVLVCGGRDYENQTQLWAALDAVHGAKPISLLVHGMARGADLLAERWAAERGVRCQGYPADWRRHGQRAGPARNRWMFQDSSPDLVIAAPDYVPGHNGTTDMISVARSGNTPVKYVDEWP